MPDLLQFLAALAIAAGVSAVVALAFGAAGAPAAARGKAVCALAIVLGLACGWYVLRLPISWPPASGLSRLLTIVLPAVFALELVAACPAVPRWLAWGGRAALAISASRVLLHGSIYLNGDKPEWSAVMAAGIHLLSGGVLMLVWTLLVLLSRRAAGPVSMSLGLAALCGGLATMLAGYVSGGAAGLPLAGALAACALASAFRKFPSDSFEGALGVGTVTLFGLVYVAHFFGQLSAGRSLAIFLAPLLCWVAEAPVLRRQPVWRKALLGLALVAIPLIAVVALAKRDFDRDTLPLLGLVTVRVAVTQFGPDQRMVGSPLVENARVDGR
ncbi:MAG TPA: hypothetical protein VF306_02030 [Pirellulales bacterium]